MYEEHFLTLSPPSEEAEQCSQGLGDQLVTSVNWLGLQCLGNDLGIKLDLLSPQSVVKLVDNLLNKSGKRRRA
jgi:hypothetical protein